MSYTRNTVERWPLLTAEQRVQKAAAEKQDRENWAVCERIMTQLLLPASIATISDKEAQVTKVTPQTQIPLATSEKSEPAKTFLAKAEYVAPEENIVEAPVILEPKEKLIQLLQKKGFSAAQVIQIFEAVDAAGYAPATASQKTPEKTKAKKKEKSTVKATVPVGTEVQFPNGEAGTQVVVRPIKPCIADSITKSSAKTPISSAGSSYFNERDKSNGKGVVKIPVTVPASPPKESTTPVTKAPVAKQAELSPVAGITEVADVYLFLAKGAVVEAAAGYAYLIQQDPSLKQEKLNKLIMAQQAATELKTQLKDYPGVLNVSVAQREQKFVVEVAVKNGTNLHNIPVSHNNVMVRVRIKQTVEEYQQQK